MNLGAEVVIRCDGSYQQVSGLTYDFHPYFIAIRGNDYFFHAWVVLEHLAATVILAQLRDNSVAAPDHRLNYALSQYGVRRMEAALQEVLDGSVTSEDAGGEWRLDSADAPELIGLATYKPCDYQRQQGRDLFCLSPTSSDPMATYSLAGQRAAPTSRAVCRDCGLPDGGHLCSHLLHPEVAGLRAETGPFRRQLTGAQCDLGKSEIGQPDKCRPGGNSCWQYLVTIDPAPTKSVSALALAESFDVLDAAWRLAFGRNKRLLTLNVAASSASLALGCTSRVEFESRLSALADLISKLRVGDELLPEPPDGQQQSKGSLDRIRAVLFDRMPPEQHPSIEAAVIKLRKVVQARNAIAHGITGTDGLVPKLRELNIHDAPPNWSGGWDSIRAQTTDALTNIRGDLMRWIDADTAKS